MRDGLMIRSRTTRLAMWAALALGGLLFAGDPPSASASCGDYVHILTPGQTATDTGTTAPHQKPCSGPGCREAPPAPMPTPPPAPTTVSPHDAILSALLPPAPAGGEWECTEPILSPRRAATAIFHPPRV
jgi:hypothetical protein